MAKAKISKSQEIRDYFRKNPNASAPAVAKEFGVSTALVYNARSTMAKAAGGAAGKTRRRRRKTRKAAAASEGNGDVNQVIAAAKLIKSCGSIESARVALNAAEKVAAALG